MKVKSYKTIQVGEIPPDYPDKCFDQILAFLGYGFCKCVWELCSVFVQDKDLNPTPVLIKDLKVGDKVLAPTGDGNRCFVEVLNIWKSRKEICRALFENGKTCKTSLEHRYLCQDGRKHTLKEIFNNRDDYMVLTVDGYTRLKGIEFQGEENVVDIEVDHPLHCFYADGVAVSNSHALSYSMYSAVGLWLKAYYPLEFMCVNLSATERSDEKKGVSLLDQRVKYCRSLGIKVSPADVRLSGNKWMIQDGGLLAPLSNLKGIGVNDVENIVTHRPYSSVTEFMDKTHIGESKFDTLLLGGALDCFGEREYLYNWYHEFYSKQKGKKRDTRQITFLDAFDEGFEIKTQLPRLVLDDAFFEINGFSMDEDLLKKHAKLVDGKVVKALGVALSERKTKHNTVLCRIREVSNFTSKSGAQYRKIRVSDGNDEAETILQNGEYLQHERALAVGNVVLLPIVLNDNDGFYIDNLDRCDVKVIERAR